MPHRIIADLIDSFQPLSSFDEVASCWLRRHADMSGFTTLFTFDEIGSVLPIESVLGSYDGEKFYIRSIFSKPNVYFLDEYIWSLMTGHGKARFPILCVLSFDTQFGNYALKYINDRAFKNTEIGASFHRLIRYIFENDIAFDFVFYLIENFANYLAGHEKEIKNQLFALKKLADLDRALFLDTGEIKLPYETQILSEKVQELIGSYKNNGQKKEYIKKEHLQSNIATVLLKSALLKRESISKEEKVVKLVDFMDQDISAILQRELVICGKWLLGEQISFFDPINGGPRLYDIPRKINGMAWDLMLLRHVEQYCSLVEKGNYTIAYYSSFDRRFIEAGDLYKNKGCLFPPKSLLARYFMLPDIDLKLWLDGVIGCEKNQMVFNDQAWKRRDQCRPASEEISALRRQLEYQLIKELSPKKKNA